MSESKMLNDLKSVLAAMGVEVRVINLDEDEQVPPAQEENVRDEEQSAKLFVQELIGMLAGEQEKEPEPEPKPGEVEHFIQFLKNILMQQPEPTEEPTEEKPRGKFEIGDVVVHQGVLCDVFDITTTGKGKTRLSLLRMDGSTVTKVRPRELDAVCHKEFVSGLPYILSNRVFAFSPIGDGEIPEESRKVIDGVFVTENSAGGSTPWAFKGLYSSVESMHLLVRAGVLKPISVVQWKAMPDSVEECECDECRQKQDDKIQVGERVVYPTRSNATGVVVDEEHDPKFKKRRLVVRLDNGITLSNLENHFHKA